DLSGWRAFDGTAPAASWVVRDGALMLDKRDGEMRGDDLVTANRYGAFELTLDWKVARGGNSGVLYLARNVAGAPLLYQSGLEMQVLDNAGHSDGRIPT
ncbi:3-keto-disaccharide hydrolase, partial [Campylobacter jejuni]